MTTDKNRILKGVILKSAILLLVITLQSASQFQEETTVGGYGELHYNEPDGDKHGQLDFHRFVIFLSHTFTEEITFYSEVEIEHTIIEAGADDVGELAIEQAYLDWRLNEGIGLRTGIILPPVGIINQVHEPTTFNGVERPNVDRSIIPTTWREAGAGAYGKLSDELVYQIYIVAGLQSSGFSGAEGIREGRQEGFRSDPTNPSLTGRLEYISRSSLKLGGSWFWGNTTGGVDSLGNGTLSLISGDARYSIGQFSFRGVAAFESLGDAHKINAAYADSTGSFTKAIADRMYGYYIEGSYDILPHFVAATEQTLNIFGRYERYNTHAATTGFSPEPAYDRNEITFGITYKPAYNVAFKADYQLLNNGADSDAKLLNFGIGYEF